MIEKIHIQNFKCLLDTEVDLGPFNVLIGPNDSGKSSFLQALNLLGAAEFGDMTSLVWQRKANRNIVLDVSGRTTRAFQNRLEILPGIGMVIEALRIDQEEKFDTATIDRGGRNTLIIKVGNKGIEIGPDDRPYILGQLPLNLPSMPTVIAIAPNQRPLARLAAVSDPTVTGLDHFADVLALLQSSEVFQLDPDAMRSQAQAIASPSLAPRGGNLAAVLQAMLSGPDRQAILDLESKLHDAIPTLKGVSTPVTSTNAHQIDFTLNIDAKPPITIPCSQASDGAMLLTGFLVLAYGSAPRRLLIEEPENGLHPSRLKMVIDMLRKISTGEIGNEPRQVIVTTHSPLLLNFVQPEEVRIFRRDETQGTKVTAMDQAPNIGRLRREFAPGELWYLFGEEDLVKGQAS